MASRSPRARPERPAAVPIPARIWWMAAVTGSGAFMAMLDSTVANLALEPVRSEFGTTLALVQWVATGYLVAGAVSLPAAAWLGDRFGHGRVWAVSLAAFTAASAVCALAPGPMVLIAARAAQGLAAGAMVPAGQAVIASEAGAERMGRLIGALGVVVSLGPAVGPAVGGLLVEAVSWRWVFAINVPVGIAALLAARALVPAGRADRSRRLDLRGLLLLGTGLPLLLFGATEVGAGGAAPLPLLAAATGAVLVAVFAVAAVRAASSPLLDLRLLGRPAFAAATATAALTGAAMYGGLLLLAVYLPEAGRGGTEAGMLLLAMGLGSAAALYAGGALTDRRGPRAVSVVGAVLLAAATAAVLLPGPEGALSTAALAVVLVVRGAGMALAQMPAVTAAYGAVPPGRVGDAATLVNISQRVGGALGAAGVVLAVVAGGGGPRGYVVGFTALTAVALLAGLTATALRRGGAGPSERD